VEGWNPRLSLAPKSSKITKQPTTPKLIVQKENIEYTSEYIKTTHIQTEQINQS
jgi:hypothetical protein